MDVHCQLLALPQPLCTQWKSDQNPLIKKRGGSQSQSGHSLCTCLNGYLFRVSLSAEIFLCVSLSFHRFSCGHLGQRGSIFLNFSLTFGTSLFLYIMTPTILYLFQDTSIRVEFCTKDWIENTINPNSPTEISVTKVAFTDWNVGRLSTKVHTTNGLNLQCQI